VGLLAVSSVFSGCLITGGSKTDIVGREVSPAEIASIKPGETTEESVLQLLGPATTTTQLSDGVMHSWVATRTERKAGAVFLIFANKSEKSQRTTLSVTCKQGMVTNVSTS